MAVPGAGGKGRRRVTAPGFAVLASLYAGERLSVDEIGERFGVHSRTVWKWLAAKGISRRSLHGTAPAFAIDDNYDDELQRILRYINGELADYNAGHRGTRDDVERLTASARIHLRQFGRTEQRVA